MRPCEVCGWQTPRFLLRSPRLDGPLVRCPRCGLVYVGAREHDFTFAAADPDRTRALGEQVDSLGIVDREVEEAERPQREQAQEDRLRRLLRHAACGRLLDVGCALGDFLKTASPVFDAAGVEPDPGTAAAARAAGSDVRTGTLAELAAAPPPERYDVITMFHVIEHLDSPRAALRTARGLLRDHGVLVVETPTVENLWFKVAPSRWRQLIPDHYWFFSRPTLERLLRECRFRVVGYETVGREVTLRFAADRLRRAGLPAAALLPGVLDKTRAGERTVRLNPGDIMQLTARAT